MPAFTIETTYHLPIYRHHVHTAANLAEACRRAINDDDWRFERRDYDTAGPVFVSGAWLGPDTAYRGNPLAVPSHFDEPIQRKADHFGVLLALLKLCAAPDNSAAQAAIAKAEAILAGTPDPLVPSLVPGLVPAPEAESGRRRASPGRGEQSPFSLSGPFTPLKPTGDLP